jgi:hypothetical protein
MEIEISRRLALEIMEKHRQDIDLRVIAEYANVSPTFISNFVKAFNGNVGKLNILAYKHQEVIRQVSPFYQIVCKNKVEIDIVDYYECRILFGLITLKIKPINHGSI